jgi:hypothetical protein
MGLYFPLAKDHVNRHSAIAGLDTVELSELLIGQAIKRPAYLIDRIASMNHIAFAGKLPRFFTLTLFVKPERVASEIRDPEPLARAETTL